MLPLHLHRDKCLDAVNWSRELIFPPAPPSFFFGLVATHISCPHHTLPVHWAITPRAVLAWRAGYFPGHTAGSCWPGVTWGAALALLWVFLSISLGLCSAQWPLCPLQQMPTLQQRKCIAKISPAPLSSMGSNYPCASPCLARANDNVASLLLTALSALQLLMISFFPKTATVQLISIIKLKLRAIISNLHLVRRQGLCFKKESVLKTSLSSQLYLLL